ncbi:MAG TPA: hypothetical protein PLW31_03145 [Bacteroidales bacterium]|nr:hypothetical protein [Bacteroidales bacterium]
MSYIYWNDFVKKWQSLPAAALISPAPAAPFHPFCGWENPNLQPLMNSDIPGDYSLKYLPEPWWGNDGRHLLNSVVINYNPGAGGPGQLSPMGTMLGLNYQDFVNNEATGLTSHLPKTNDWHRNKRSKKVFDTLERIGIALGGNNALCNFLSVELIPWHTTNTSDIKNYINRNLLVIYENCILFAANQSINIGNDKLRNKVLLRISGSTTRYLLKAFDSKGIRLSSESGLNYIPSGLVNTPYSRNLTSGKAGYYKFEFKDIPNVTFISIWGKTSRNNFPADGDLEWIFTHII